MSNRNVTPLLFYKQDVLYEAAFDLYLDEAASNAYTIEDCFKKGILYVITWLKDRMAAGGIDLKWCDDPKNHMEFRGLQNIKNYPELANFREFDYRQAKLDLSARYCWTISAAYEDDCKTWAFRLDEPDNRTIKKEQAGSGEGNDDNEVFGRSFVTEATFTLKKDKILFGTRLTYRQRHDEVKTPLRIRPAFVKDLFQDEAILMVEEGLDRKYAFQRVKQQDGEYSYTGAPIVIDRDFSSVMSEFVNNETRRLPIIFLPDDDCITKAVDVSYFARHMLGFAHVVQVKQKAQSFFADKLQQMAMYYFLQEGCPIVYQKADEEVPEKTRYRFEKCSVVPNRNFSALENPTFSVPDANKLFDLKKFEPKPASKPDYPYKRSCSFLLRPMVNTKLTINDEEIKKNTHSYISEIQKKNLSKTFEDASLIYFSDIIRIQNKDYQSENISELKERNLVLEREIDTLVDEKSSLLRENETLKQQNQNLLDKDEQNQDELRKLNTINQKVALLEQDKNDYQKQVKNLSGENERLKVEAKRAYQSGKDEFTESYQALWHVPMDRAKLISWAKAQYKGTLIITDETERGILDDTRTGISDEIYYELINLAHIYTKKQQKGESVDDLPNHIVYGRMVSMAPIGSYGNDKLAKRYEVDLSRIKDLESALRAKNTLGVNYERYQLNMHFKVGNQNETCVRMYFQYFPEIQKTVVGHIGRHLPTERDKH